MAETTNVEDPLTTVAVVLVTYRSADLILDALRALPRERLADVVVVDNASDDGTADVVEAAGVDGVRLLRRSTNDGFGAGCNAGADAVGDRADLLLFLNPDARLSPESLQLLIRHLSQNERCALVAPRLCTGGEPISSAGGRARLVHELRFVVPAAAARLFPDRRLPPGYDRTGQVPVVEGACMLVRRAAWRHVGGFDPGYFLFFEEHDFAARLESAGWTVDLCAAAWAEHSVGASRAGIPLAGRAHYLRSAVRFLRTRRALSARVYVLLAVASFRWKARNGRIPVDDAELCIRALREAASDGRSRSDRLFVSWIRNHGRSVELAAALDADPVFVAVGRQGQRALAPLRYAVQGVLTLLALLRRRPRTLVMMAPPDSLLVLGLIYRQLHRGCTLVADAHTSAVLDLRSSRPRSRFAALSRRLDAVVVTNSLLSQHLSRARTFCVDDPIARAAGYDRWPPPSSRPLVVFPSGWAADEPWEALVQAARDLDDVDVVVTGRPHGAGLRCGAGALPGNLHLTGYLRNYEYDELLSSAHVLLALTTREGTMQRAGYEALAHARPLVVSSTAVLRDYFQDAALYTDNDAASLTGTIREAVAAGAELHRRMRALADQRAERQREQVATLRSWLVEREG